MSSPVTTGPRCTACGEPGAGRFCSACGAPLAGAACAGCDAALTPGAKFCHRCGLAAGAQPSAATPTAGAPQRGAAPATGRSLGSVLRWGGAFVALLAIFAMAAGRNFGRAQGGGLDAPLNALPQVALGEGPAGAPAGAPPAGMGGAPFAGGASGSRAPDLSSMTPREMADRLFDRVMRLSAEGKADSAAFFATMALQNYASMPLDLDLRYDMGRVAEVVGNADVARAQADTILARSPTHLLGLVLAGKAAALRGDGQALAGYQRRLVAAAPAERTKNVDEYQRHANDIDAALQQAANP